MKKDKNASLEKMARQNSNNSDDNSLQESCYDVLECNHSLPQLSDAEEPAICCTIGSASKHFLSRLPETSEAQPWVGDLTNFLSIVGPTYKSIHVDLCSDESAKVESALQQIARLKDVHVPQKYDAFQLVDGYTQISELLTHWLSKASFIMILFHGCQALGNSVVFLSKERTAKAVLKGRFDILLEIMQQYPSDSSIQKLAISALFNLVEKVHDNESCLIHLMDKRDGIRLALATMEIFPSDSLIEIHGLSIFEIIFKWESLEKMMERAGIFPDFLQRLQIYYVAANEGTENDDNTRAILERARNRVENLDLHYTDDEATADILEKAHQVEKTRAFTSMTKCETCEAKSTKMLKKNES